MGALKELPEPEEVPVEARHSARGLKRWLEERRARGVNPDGEPLKIESCIMHDHDE